MRQVHGMGLSAKGTASLRWQRMVFCLLFALSTLFYMDQSASAQVHATALHVASASDEANPCGNGPGSAGHHCQAAGVGCSLCAPVATTSIVPDRTSTPASVMAEQIALGDVANPLFRPPKLPLQV